MDKTILAIFFCVSCSGSIQRPLHEVVSCVKQEAPLIAGEFEKLASLVPDWKAIAETAISDARDAGYRVVGCALARLTAKSKSAPIAGSSPARAAMEQFRAQAAMGADFDLRGAK
jgi:hypothetical protein